MILYSFFLGLILGSFANVYFYRYPLGLSVVFPRSRCPACGTTLRWFDNIPVLSYVILRGKCRSCSARFSLQYPLVELSVGLLFSGVAYKYSFDGILAIAAFLAFSFCIFLAGGIDLATYFKLEKKYGIIPDHLTYPLIALGLAYARFNPLVLSLKDSILSSVCVAAFLLAFRWLAGKILKQEALGLGDVKLLIGVAAWLGWQGFVISLFVGSLLGSVISLALIAAKKMERKSALPFGPYLAAGILSAIFLV